MVSFDGRENELVVQDPIERRTCTLQTFSTVRPKPVPSHPFPFPVDDAVRLSSGGFRLSPPVAAYVRDSDGEMVRSVEGIANEELPDGTYSIELCAPIKLYVHVDEAFSISATFDEMSFEFESETDIVVGGQSFHRRPSDTVTTTTDPTDVMATISTFGSAMKTTSPERAFPTLRGHPPAVELGDELHIPDGLQPPETDVAIEVPPTLESVFAVASLAYYLGARVVPGNTPRIVAGDFEHPLDVARGFETEVEQVLKQTFLLDCVTRTEGLYPVELYERRQLESMVELDFAALYDASPAERLEQYLSIPYPDIEEFVPEWQLTTHVSPAASNVEMLPFLVDDLAVIRTARGTAVSASTVQVPAGEQFVRGSSERSESNRSASETAATPRSFVEPEQADSLEQVWVGDDAPIGASKATLTAFRNRLERTAAEGEIDITVVCNDDEMDEERNLADEVYGSERNLRFDVTVRHDLSVAELRSVLESETHFLHYIGHIDDGGFNCRDGTLDAAELDAIGVEAFLLNACQSYEQGMALIEAGAIGGVVTLSDVINSGAVRVGKAMARLLNRGFPLWAALDIARDRSIIGGQYTVVGDGSISVVQTEGPVAVLLRIESTPDGYDVTPITYVPNEKGMGSFVNLHLTDDNTSYLSSGPLEKVSLGEDELQRGLLFENVPVTLDGQFTWSNEIEVSQL